MEIGSFNAIRAFPEPIVLLDEMLTKIGMEYGGRPAHQLAFRASWKITNRLSWLAIAEHHVQISRCQKEQASMNN
ncbi:MAG: hypothetical protein AAGE05_11405 [Pseudomonadota bacterium]